MNIGDVSRASGVSAKMIRYYEQVGLLPAPGRSAAGYRIYDDRDLHMLRFIRRARDLGFSVAEIGELLALWQDRTRRSADVKHVAQKHLEVLQARIRDMQQMSQTLQTLVSCCAGDDRPDCPILADLQELPTGVPAGST